MNLLFQWLTILVLLRKLEDLVEVEGLYSEAVGAEAAINGAAGAHSNALEGGEVANKVDTTISAAAEEEGVVDAGLAGKTMISPNGIETRRSI